AGKGWDKAYDAAVPGSIYTALTDAGVIEDPYLSDNMKQANKYSEKNWYFFRTFTYEGKGERVELAFDGLCNVADIYLNGKKISSHEGMFGGPYIDVTNAIKKGENTLMVHLYPAKHYADTVVFNCSYGWHYAKLFPLGIWQSVTVRDVPTVTLDSPFITTVDHEKGTVDLAIELDRQAGPSISGELTVSFTPKNFEGTAAYFTKTVSAGAVDSTTLRYRCDIPDFKLWWPGGYGDQNLYTMKVTFEAADGTVSCAESDFGIRTLDYKALPAGEHQNTYNRVFVINGKDIYMKGAGWCTLDSMMRFTREDYDRILSRARDAGINYFRAWGGGLVETEEFYDLCDEYGICVYQEWPCCWDSTNTQPADVLYETVILGAKRLRNRASLVVWGGGNEGAAPYSDKVLNNIGKLTYETDGTRDFWRQDGGTGGTNITHDHIWWSGASPEHYIKTYSDMQNVNLTEYGLGAMMNLDSIAKYATAAEMAEWPVDQKGVIAYHTSTFNGFEGWNPSPHGYDIDTHLHYASTFYKVDSLADLVRGSQLAQAQADYLPAMNARINYPYSSMNVVYKLNDNYPGASWAIVDWYGAPKISYYMMQDAYRTLMAAPKTDHYNTYNAAGEAEALTLPVYVLDDLDVLKGKEWSVKVTAYGEDLSVVKTQTFTGKGSVGTSGKAGDFALTAGETDNTPLTVTFDLYVGGRYQNRTFVYFNYEYEPGSLFYLPRTSLSYSVSGNTVTIKNTGELPALGVELTTKDTSKFVTSDNFFFLAAGENVTVTVNDGGLVEGVTCFNLKNTADKAAPTVPEEIKISDVAFDSATVSWTPSTDEGGLFGYNVTLTDKNGKATKYFAQDGESSILLKGLAEVSKYSVTVEAVDNGGNCSGASASKSFTTLPDRSRPALRTAFFGEGNTVILTFSTAMDKTRAQDPAYYMLNHGATVKSAILSKDGMTVTLTCEGIAADKAYTVGVIGLTDTKHAKNSIGFVSATVEKDLYLSVDFEDDGNGRTYSGGEISGVLEKLSAEPVFTDKGHMGRALSGGAGMQLREVPYTFNEGKTMTMWVNGKASSGYNVLIAKGPKTAGHFEIYLKDGQMYFFAPDLGDYNMNFDLNTLGDGWHQLAFAWKNGYITVYADGKAVGGCTAKGTVKDTVEVMAFGGQTDGSMAFGGLLDTVRLYDRLLTDEELMAGAEHESAYAKAEGNDIGKSFKTDFSFGDGTTVNLWFNAEGMAESFGILLAKGTKATNRHFEIYTEQGRLSFYAPAANNGNALSLEIDLKSYVGGWHMLTVVHDAGKLEVYIDGVHLKSIPADFSLPAGGDACYYGRLVEGGFDFPGKITEGELLNEVLAPDQIKARYESHLVIPEPEGGIKVESPLITLLPGESAELGITAYGATELKLTTVGDAATVKDGKVTAEKVGETLIYAVSEDGKYIGGAVVLVVESIPEDTTESDTEEVTDPGTDPTETNPVETPPATEAPADPVETPTEPSETDPPRKKGCRSSVGMLSLSILLALWGGWLGLRRRDE
ncbi:MAG: fibronectin type III domain-containing protein, partial [Clostridia bacterium]|nr:fibronectin type III domain-containing protein [Clostridia bacterium]